MCGSYYYTYNYLFFITTIIKEYPPTRNNNNFEQPKHALPDWFPAAAEILFVSAGSRGGKPIQLEVQNFTDIFEHWWGRTILGVAP